jgi:DNA-binding MarR family transcriptional regulator
MTSERPDLGATLHRLAGLVIDREIPVLRGHGVQMWDYVVLSGLGRGPAPSQAELAAAVGRDRTRLIPILDRLEARGLLERTADPRDRRYRVVRLTPGGRDLLTECRASIRAMEEELLADLPAGERGAFRATLERLATSIEGMASPGG